MIRRAWKTAASVRLTFWLLMLAVLFFVIGSVYMRLEKEVLPLLNFQLLPAWIARYGLARIGLSRWLFALLFTLLLLGINTFACSIDRLRRLLPQRRQMARNEFAVAVAPTLVHLAFLLVLGGHLLSSAAGSVETVSCAAGRAAALAGGRSLEVLAVRYVTHETPPALAGKLKGMSADLRYRAPGVDERFSAAVLAPVRRAGYRFHLDAIDKYARTRELRLIVRRDPGIGIILPGLAAIILLMAWYYAALRGTQNKPNDKEK